MSKQTPKHTWSRRSFLPLVGAAPLVAWPGLAASGLRQRPRIPVGLEIYSVKDEEKKDLLGTLAAVAKMGYEGVEFWAPYLDWTPAYAKQVRTQLDALGLRCFSTHNRDYYFTPENLARAIDLNGVLGSKYIVMAGAGKPVGADGWKKLAAMLTEAHEKMRPAGLRCGFHNLTAEWKPLAGEGGGAGQRPIDILTANTPKDLAFQVDTATCMASGGNPVAFVQANPGRVKSFHLKDWSPEPDQGYKVLLGEGIGPWKKLTEVAERTGGVEYYLVEQEGSRFPPMETVKRCLDNFRKLRAG